jgi:MFS superfamily sulfate permease-like transporter
VLPFVYSSVLIDNVGGPHATQLHNVFSSFVVLLALLVLTPLLAPLPKCVLAAVIFIALKSLVMSVTEWKRLWAIRRADFVMWLGTFLSTLIGGTEIGIAIGVLTSGNSYHMIVTVHCCLVAYVD